MIEQLKDRSVIYIHGADSKKLLQGQTTNDIIKNQYCYTYILNNQGRYLFDFICYKDKEDAFYLDINSNIASNFIKRLSMYKLRSEVELEDVSNEYAVLYSRDVIKNSLYSLQDPRNKNLSYRSIVEKNSISKELIKDINLYNNDKYEHCIIDGSSDLVYEKSIPIEYGADAMNAIDYHKGCYIGQEVISRAKYQGVVRKKIYRMVCTKEITNCDKGAFIVDLDGNKLGIICSIYKNIAIVLLREEKYLGLSEKKAMIGNQVADILPPNWEILSA